ncbi:MAG: alanine--tRNA ligase [Lentisphaerae bacterium]|jgi:alanyl-tRNA synthetase|nr:alanine--tRNA ligase [Lentisphaerota bacterium]MBT4819424.1 alanine--tRNA ligase [Lentisphaerota bacterium]MBT5605187.1 alanine--tRNA ligase [Lentisphaerota bacterium]MBT7054361.1 alanine--tRNA ligase [Lentisphaerota bacterium]MBT7844855.1 alanine--tRNA ligase [Lentisphaerota bacterium]
MLAKQLRQAYIDFFKRHGHAQIDSAPLVPENDPTVLFTTAGMHPLVPFLLGAKHPAGTRLVDYQKCVRTGDIDEVGDTTHLTFFEMLGNWSLGDYFKEEAIAMSHEFLTKELGIDPELLWVSCFAGDEDAPRDEEAAAIWMKQGIPAERIVFLGKEHNWWGPAGQTGPCGPDTEMFIELDKPSCGPDCGVACNCGKYVEIWNDVFMQYNKTENGTFEPLAQKNVDTGMGLERVTAVLQGKASCFETEIFSGLLQKLAEISGVEDPGATRSGRIVVEHMRAATFLMGDGVRPANVDQAYVLRRLIRRAIREARKLGVSEPFTPVLADVVVAEYGDVYTELAKNRDDILKSLADEEAQFAGALERGTREFCKLVDSFPAHVERKVISGRKAFYLYETFGFPLELTIEMAAEREFTVDTKGYEKAYAKHQQLSRAGAEQKFKGGLADSSDTTAALHTATHLLHAALRKILGGHVGQAGSNITADRLRFDFTHPAKVTAEERSQVQGLVNEAIQRDLPISFDEMSLEEARGSGAIALFDQKYGEKVRVYSIGDVSREVCGGPHAERTGALGAFRITKEESSSRGVRRIKAVLE